MGKDLKIFIGITQDLNEVETLLASHNGLASSLTELGPFWAKDEALEWLAYLSSKILTIEDITNKNGQPQDASWYGFTFESMA